MVQRGRDASVGVLQRFERRVGGLVEGAFAKVFKGDVQPVEIAQTLQREADDKRTIVAEGRVLVPNEYVVELGDHDYARLHPYADPLGAELAAMVQEHAAEQGYSFVGPVKVALELMPDIDTGTFRVRSGVNAGGAAHGALLVQTGSGASDLEAAADPRGTPPGRPRLVVAAGGSAPTGSPQSRGEEPTLFLNHAVTVIGRSADADLRLDDPGVSRKHAEIRQEGGGFVVVDLGSTNGVRVNQQPVTRHRLISGDRIELGSTVLLYRRDPDD